MSTIYYWIAGKKDSLFICSFTINNELEQLGKKKVEIQIVEVGDCKSFPGL
jgi:hypothetical protein